MKKMIRAFLTVLLAVLFMIPVTVPGAGAVQEVYAETETEAGWQQNSKGWWYRNEDGTYPKSQWMLINGRWYHFDAKGYMQTGWIVSVGNWYYLNKNGAMTTGWKKISGKWFYFEPDGVMATGFKELNGSWYYLKSSGVMATGWVAIDGHWYYFNPKGTMAKGWKAVNGKWYYLDTDGTMVTGWLQYKDNWYYLNAKGVMSTGWVKYKGKWYYMSNAGKMMKNGWFKINGSWYYLKKNGVMYKGWLSSKNNWFYLKKSGEMAVGWQDVQEETYWFDQNGVMATGLRTIDGDFCYFRPKGQLQSDGSSPEMIRLKEMTTEEKTAQLFFVRPEVLSEPDAYAVGNTMKTAFGEIPVGGMVLFAQNISTPEQVKKFTADIHSLGETQVMICVDEEGGPVARLANTKGFNLPKYKDMETVGDTGDPANAKEVGNTIGAYLKEYGFDCDLAPDADVDQNGYSNGIGRRAFSKDPKVAAKMVAAAIEGFHEEGVITCAKHFPGHGATDTDTHYDYSVTDKTWDELLACDIVPFKSAIKAGVDMIMAGHISIPNVTGDETPASVNKKVITDKIRKELGYDGVVITDAIGMEAVSDVYSQADISVKALNAGADIILMPEDLEEAYYGVLSAVNNGTVSENRLNEAVYRILYLKAQYGMKVNE
ncbi:MAG: hypothetical protein K6G61_12760 [Solobacterium sp.]|nr:hypothetical protein [Solobacterium sp.]